MVSGATNIMNLDYESRGLDICAYCGLKYNDMCRFFTTGYYHTCRQHYVVCLEAANKVQTRLICFAIKFET